MRVLYIIDVITLVFDSTATVFLYNMVAILEQKYYYNTRKILTFIYIERR